MKDKRNAIIAVIVLAVVIVGAGVGYNMLKPQEGTGAVPAAQMTNQIGTTGQGSTGGSASTGNAGSSSGSFAKSSSSTLTDFTVLDANGNSVKLSSMQGKPTVVGYWATWCPYCVKEAPTIQKLYDTYGDRVNFMMIDVIDGQRDTVDGTKAWLEQQGYTYPVYYDTTNEASIAGKVYYLPTTFILNAKGSVVTSITSAASESTLTTLLDKQLAS